MSSMYFTEFSAFLASAMLIPAVVFLALCVNHRTMRFWMYGAATFSSLFLGSAAVALSSFLPTTTMILLGNAMIMLGYFFSLRTLRLIKQEFRLERIDLLLLLSGLIAFTSIVGLANEYTNRVAVMSAYITVISGFAFWMAVTSRGRVSIFGDTIISTFAVGNVFTSAARFGASVFDQSHTWLHLAFWDPVFFVWSIAAVFCFAIGFFINGTTVLSKNMNDTLQNQQRLAAALEVALEDQRNLQKLMLHEVKRPLNAISSTVQAMQVQSNVASYELKKLRQLTQQANAYLESLSEFEEINSLLDHPNVQVVSIEALAGDLHRKWDVRVSGLHAKCSETVCIDEFLFDIALGNLIENARRYGASSSGVEVKIAIDLNEVIFDVTDDGSGISPSEAKKVFGKFYKTNNVPGNVLTGCGLGLYVVQRIAEAHKGYACVASQKPSVVRLILPLWKGFIRDVQVP